MPNKVPENFSLADLKGRNFATVSQTAAVLGADPRTVRADIAEGDIPAIKVGRDYPDSGQLVAREGAGGMSQPDEPDWAALFDARDLAEVFGQDDESGVPGTDPGLPASNPEVNPETAQRSPPAHFYKT